MPAAEIVFCALVQQQQQLQTGAVHQVIHTLSIKVRQSFHASVLSFISTAAAAASAAGTIYFVQQWQSPEPRQASVVSQGMNK
jgi:ABC-type enterobactin transport system permease subunit